jgi:hypothetical protein
MSKHQLQNGCTQGILKKFGYVFTALLVSHLDTMSNSIWRWDFEVGVSCCEEINKLMVRDNICGAIAFGYPFFNMGTNGQSEFRGMYQRQI